MIEIRKGVAPINRFWRRGVQLPYRKIIDSPIPQIPATLRIACIDTSHIGAYIRAHGVSGGRNVEFDKNPPASVSGLRTGQTEEVSKIATGFRDFLAAVEVSERMVLPERDNGNKPD